MVLNLSELTEHQREVCYARVHIIGSIEQLKRKGHILPDVLKHFQISRSTYFEWKRNYKNYGLPGLADHSHLRREGKRKMTQEQQAFLCEQMLTQNRPKSLTIYEIDYVPFCDTIGQEPVSYQTFLRAFDEIPDPVKVLFRHGQRAFDDSNPYIERDLNSLKPLEMINSDHYRMDRFMITDAGKLFRPWVTWWMDIGTRKALGWVMSLMPSQDTINLALYYVISKYGIAENAYIDNGKDYKGKMFTGIDASGKQYNQYRQHIDEVIVRGIYQRFNINVIFALPYNAKAKPIEPAHRTIHNLERRYYGYVGSNVVERPEEFKGVVAAGGKKYAIKMDNLPNFQQMEAQLDEIMWEYNNRKHDGLGGISPEEAWNERYQPRPLLNPDDLQLLMMRPDTKLHRLHPQGIYFKHKRQNWYYHPGMVHLEGKSVGVRFDPRNVDERGNVKSIMVYDAKDRFLFEAPMRGKAPALGDNKGLHGIIGQQKKIRRKSAEGYVDDRKNILQNMQKSEMTIL